MPSFHLQNIWSQKRTILHDSIACLRVVAINGFINIWTQFKLLSNDQINHFRWMT